MNQDLAPNQPGPYVMGIDVGTTNIKAGLITADGRVAHYASQPTVDANGQRPLATTLVETCRQVLQRAGTSTRNLVAVGCCAPGCVEPESGVIVASAIPGWQGVEVRAPLERAFARPVTVEGQGNAAALAAHAFGPTRKHSPVLAVVVGTGIDGGCVVDGKLLRGAGHAALDIGHLVLFHPGRPCLCGRTGCWMAHAGGGALVGRLNELRAAGHQLPGLPEEIAELAQASHEEAIALWEEQGTLLGAGMAALLDVINPRSVLLCGGIMRAWPLFKKNLLKTAREQALPRNAEAAIVSAPEPERTCLLGAAVAAVQASDRPEFFEAQPGEDHTP